MELVSFLSGCGMGGLLFTAGLAIGLWMTRVRNASQSAHRQAVEHTHQLVQTLFRFTHSFAGDVGQCRSAMENIGQQLHEATRSSDQAAPFPLTLDSVEILTRLAETNERLHHRLCTAETVLKQQAEEIASYLSEARTDPLTGLPNRRAFEGCLANHFEQWRRHSVPLSLLLLDIDHFKAVNDRFGHPAGDEVLEGIGRVVALARGDRELAARFGGEEFALILPGIRLEEGCQAAERIRLAVSQGRLPFDGQVLTVTVSCGVATAQTGEDVEALIKRADLALYAAKDAGRNRAYLHDGQRCLPICPETGVRLEPPQPAVACLTSADSPPASRFSQVCDDLRRRLLEVMEEQEESAAR